jgi:tetratricopeptide (TPR) repeat protein
VDEAAAAADVEAARVQREVLDLFARSLGPNHTADAGSLGTYSDILMESGRFDDAIAMRRRATDIRRRLFGADNAGFGIDLSKLARVHARKGDYAVADSLFRLALANQKRYVPETHVDVRRIYQLMAERYRLDGNVAEAARYAGLGQPR